MGDRPTPSVDVLLLIAKEFDDDEDILNFSLVREAVYEPVSRWAFKKALTATPFDHELRPVTYAIDHGDIPLLTRCLDFLDSAYPQGWKWSQFYNGGVARVLHQAAAHNLKSLQFLVGRYPLWPPSDEESVPSKVLDHGFYTYHMWYHKAMADNKNWALVISALESGLYDCASFLLRGYHPPLFPQMFPLRGHPICYASAATLQFLINHGADLGRDALCSVAGMAGLADAHVFDILVQRGYRIDAPRFGFAGTPMGEVLTPLYFACNSSEPTNVEALLRLGANPNGIAPNPWIRKSVFLGEFSYFSPNPILTLVVSSQWDLTAWDDEKPWKFIQCLRLLLRYGATVSVPLHNGTLLEALVLRMWKFICVILLLQYGVRGDTLPDCPDKPYDRQQGVQSLLLALSSANLSPWDEVYQLVSDVDSTWPRNVEQPSAQLIQLFRDYQEKYGDLPGPTHLRRARLLFLPSRFGAQLHHA
ncbi:hypothetical protein GGS24DRAFT_471604 [Hypoxylon argillaceum]|nr:hypothetical protein GGS24DRAFT_471604 [Hypoxylon argillaceum]